MRFFDGCTALITGASSGFGAEFARQLAPVADSLVLVARRTDRLEALRAELGGLFPSLSVFVYGADLAVESERTKFVAWLDEQGIQIDFLINNAGLGDHGRFDAGDWERIRAMIDVNITALTQLTHALLPRLKSFGRAAILNVSSVAGELPLPNMAVYAATKAYVTSFTEAIRIELRGSGVSVTALCPGPVQTEFFEVATRNGEADQAAHYKTMPAFVVTTPEAVRAALDAVENDRAKVIPGIWLAIAIAIAGIVPFWIIRRILETGRHRI